MEFTTFLSKRQCNTCVDEAAAGAAHLSCFVALLGTRRLST